MKYSFDLDGVNCGIQLHDSLDLNTQSFTKELWFYKRDTGRGNLIGNYSTTPSSSGRNIEITADNKIRVYWSTSELFVVNRVIPLFEWHHVAWVRDKIRNVQEIYLDGELIYTHNSAGVDQTEFKTGYIGRDSRTGDVAFDGLIDEVKIWNKARTADEIKETYRSFIDLDTIPQNLIGYFNLNEGSGTVAINHADKTKNGIITGTPKWSSNLPPVLENRVLILNNGYYKKYFNSTWVIITSNLPTENDYMSGNHMLAIPSIPESAWKQLSGTVELCYYTDDASIMESQFGIDTEPFTLADEFGNQVVKVIEYTDNPTQAESTIFTETEPFSFYDEMGDSMDILYYTDDASKTTANLEITANYSPLDEINEDFEVVTWSNEIEEVLELHVPQLTNDVIEEGTLYATEINLKDVIKIK